MCVSLGWPDESLALDMYLRGLSIVGIAPDTGLWRRKSAFELRRSGTLLPVADLLVSNISFTGSLLSTLPSQFTAARARGDSEWLRMCRLTWEATLAEVAAGSAKGPFTRSRIDTMFGFGRWRPIRRFGVPKGVDGVRPCDDATLSLHNSAWFSPVGLSNCPIDFPAAVGRAFYDEGCVQPFGSGGT